MEEEKEKNEKALLMLYTLGKMEKEQKANLEKLELSALVINEKFWKKMEQKPGQTEGEMGDFQAMISGRRREKDKTQTKLARRPTSTVKNRNELYSSAGVADSEQTMEQTLLEKDKGEDRRQN